MQFRKALYQFVLAAVVLNNSPALSEGEKSNVLKGTIQHNNARETRIHRYDSGTTPSEPKVNDVQVGDFIVKSPKNLDCEVEANSQTLTLAWESWHKQLMGTIYHKLYQAYQPGRCTFTLKATKDRKIDILIDSMEGSPELAQDLVRVVTSLNGNPGLSFPEGSKREFVEMSYGYECSRDTKGGYTWKKGDFEAIQLNHK